MLIDIFQQHCPDAEIWTYGSRVTGGAHDGSDLDLAIKSLGTSGIASYELKAIIRDSNIPFLVDIVEFDKLSDSFKEEIEQKYEVLYSGK